MKARILRGVMPLLGGCILASLLMTGGSPSCKESSTTTTAGSTESNKVRIGYIGLTCEAPLVVAYENGFFKDEGLDPEMVRCDWATYKDALALGKYDVTHHLLMYLLKPIEQGLDIKITGGVHRGCLRVQAPNSGSIHTVEDLRGKRIGIPGMGTPPYIFAYRVLGAHGFDPAHDVEWKVYPAGELGLAMDKGEVDAVADAEPIGSLLTAQGKVHNVIDQATDAPYKEEYCCVVVVNGKFLSAHPQLAAKSTRAILRAAKWVQNNPKAAAELSVQKKYLGSSVQVNTLALARLHYLPSISGGEAGVFSAATEMKKVGMLNASTDINELARRAFIHLDGVSDDWINKLPDEKVAGGAAPPEWDIVKLASAIQSNSNRSCCNHEK